MNHEGNSGQWPAASGRGVGIANHSLHFSATLCLRGFFGLLMLASAADAATYKRSLDVVWDAENAKGHELAYAEFFTAGHHQEDGSDIRLTDSAGKPVAFRVLMIGPGDAARVLFSLQKNERKYAVFWGDTSKMPGPKRMDESATVRVGLLMEMYPFAGGHIDNFKDIEAVWENSAKAKCIGRTMIEKPFIGFNPFGDQQVTVTKLSGSLFAPLDGEYGFAGAADDRGALYIDGNPTLFVPGLVGDIRFNAKIHLTRGWHDFMFYHINGGGDGRVSLAWKRPDVATYDVISRDSFGFVPRCQPGSMEELGKTLTADFSAEYLGEFFVDNHYTHRIRFTVNPPKAAGQFSPQWDFGDGQKSTERSVQHVFLNDGVFPIRLTLKIGANSDTQTILYLVGRDIKHIDDPPLDDARVQSNIVARYDVKNLPAAALPWAAWLHVRAGKVDGFLDVANRMLGEMNLPDPDSAIQSAIEGTRFAFSVGKSKEILAAWDKTPQASNLQPKAVRHYSRLLVWWAGDFKRAIDVLEGFADVERNDGGEAVANEPGLRDATRLRRIYGQALILNQQAKEGIEVLSALAPQSHPERQVVISGALARTIEHYIAEGDWESGEDYWERWQTRYPADFLEGYSMVLRVKLIESRKQPEIAAKLAEAFATAMPGSSYAPTLLYEASKLLEKSNPTRSAELMSMLKTRYPEDPLSQ